MEIVVLRGTLKVELPVILKWQRNIEARAGGRHKVGGSFSLIPNVRVEGQGADSERRRDDERPRRELSERGAGMLVVGGRGSRIGSLGGTWNRSEDEEECGNGG